MTRQIDTKPFNTKKVVDNLENLMTKVTSENVNAETVKAACLCAEKITDILRLHLDVEKLRVRTKMISDRN